MILQLLYQQSLPLQKNQTSVIVCDQQALRQNLVWLTSLVGFVQISVDVFVTGR